MRDATRDYSERVGRLSESERLALLRAFDELVPLIPERTAAAVDAEIESIRKARQGGGRRTPGGGRTGGERIS